LLLLLTAVLLAACAPGTDIESAEPLSTILPPTFEVVPGRTSIERFDPPGTGGGLELTIGAQVENPNDFPIRLGRIDYFVFLGNRQVARGGIETALFLDAGGMAPVTFEIATEVGGNAELLRSVVRAFADTPLEFRVEGTLDFSSLSYGFTTRRRELFSGATLARQSVTAPALRLDEVASEVFLLRAGVPVVRAVVTADNPGDIGYFLYGKDLHLRLGGFELALADMEPVPVAAGASTRIDLLFYPDTAQLDAAANAAIEAALSGIATQMEIEGELLMDVLGVDTFTVPAGWLVVGFVDLDR
jgi:hypothetical protein